MEQRSFGDYVGADLVAAAGFAIGYGVSLKMVEVMLVLFGLVAMNCSGGGIIGGCVVMKGDDVDVVLKLEDGFNLFG
ncbi:hypothetical protein L195_g004582 [Trifolium pratense]|uniref:Uncharacterized protein n=1 Tax=Trifolium pratense TaxID=57577 RepID=A0A2K3NYG1_TRIPR|nr:hypothetical protein L195_g004582 [Trifolium pratense]